MKSTTTRTPTEALIRDRRTLATHPCARPRLTDWQALDLTSDAAKAAGIKASEA